MYPARSTWRPRLNRPQTPGSGGPPGRAWTSGSQPAAWRPLRWRRLDVPVLPVPGDKRGRVLLPQAHLSPLDGREAILRLRCWPLRPAPARRGPEGRDGHICLLKLAVRKNTSGPWRKPDSHTEKLADDDGRLAPGLQLIPADDDLEQFPHIAPGPVEALVLGVPGAAWLVEPVRVGSPRELRHCRSPLQFTCSSAASRSAPGTMASSRTRSLSNRMCHVLVSCVQTAASSKV